VSFSDPLVLPPEPNATFLDPIAKVQPLPATPSELNIGRSNLGAKMKPKFGQKSKVTPAVEEIEMVDMSSVAPKLRFPNFPLPAPPTRPKIEGPMTLPRAKTPMRSSKPGSLWSPSRDVPPPPTAALKASPLIPRWRTPPVPAQRDMTLPRITPKRSLALSQASGGTLKVHKDSPTLAFQSQSSNDLTNNPLFQKCLQKNSN
jgi:hypothetical protein